MRFAAVAEAVDRAQRALLAAVPTYRHPGAPLSVALDDFDAALAEVARRMPAWRSPVTDAWWRRCEDALAAAEAQATRLRAAPPGPEEFEALNARIGDVLAPLEDFAEAEQALRKP